MGLQLTPMQNEFLRNANHRWNIKEGATRSGKTYMDYYLIAKRIRETENRGLIAMIGCTRSTLERNIIEPMRNIWGDQMIGRGGSNTIMMFGKRVHVLGADKISQVAKLQGSGLEYCYGDEITTWNPEVFQMLKSRLSFKNSKFDGTCNPDSPNHWFRKFLDSDADIYRQSYQIYDNPTLDPTFVRELEKEYSGTVYFKRFILGEWALAEGLVYQNFSPEDDAIDSIPEPLTGDRYVSVDYGTRNPCVFLLWEQGQSGTWYCSKEYYYNGREEIHQKSDEEYADDFEEFIRGKNIHGAIIDPSATSFIVALSNRGIRTTEASNRVLDGIRFTISALNHEKIKILKCCEKMLDEFSTYSWDNDKSFDVVIKANDHAMDAMRYFCFTILRPNTGGIIAM